MQPEEGRENLKLFVIDRQTEDALLRSLQGVNQAAWGWGGGGGGGHGPLTAAFLPLPSP